ncbi:serine protease gd-like [Galleria mellonella]|uniref:Serine protease gd-like n=1 Tax=Galleria mellonella TaxID=7137 RepID=A0ABM3MKW5_GALME|nr:serine protease gd-like [Galleria mellonella]
MKRLCCCVVVLGLFEFLVNCQSPCPGIFDYRNEGGVIYGVIMVPPSGPVSSVTTRVNFTIAARLPSTYVGKLEPIGSSQILQNYNRGAPIMYRIHFPVTSPLPRLTSLQVNGNLLCYGPGDVVVPNRYISTISLQHIIFQRPNSGNFIYQFDPGSKPNSVYEFSSSPEVGADPIIAFDENDDRRGTWTSVINASFMPNNTRPLYELTEPPPPLFEQTPPHRPQYEQTPPPRPQFEQTPPHLRPQYEQTPPPPQLQFEQTPPPSRPQYEPAPPPPLPQYEQNPPPVQTPPTIRPETNYNVYYPEVTQPTRLPRPPQPTPVFPSIPERIPVPSSNTFTQVECGKIAGGNERLPLIYNGQSYSRGDWPWLVAIYRRKDGSLTFICSGTLVSDRHVISAAHCMHQKNSYTSIKDIVVKVGVYNLEDWGDDVTVTRTLEAAYIHESYNVSTLANDISVFTLERNVEFSTYIRPACLWSGNTDLSRVVGASGVVAGWGTNELGPGGHGEPRMVRIPIVSTATCRASKPDFHKLTSANTLCAGDRNGAGPCLGDSGGGLYLLDSGRWRVRGIVSLSLRPENGDNTCNLNEYIVFTDAAQYLKWIKNVMAK